MCKFVNNSIELLLILELENHKGVLLGVSSKLGPIDADRIGFFFGDGVSVEFGIPSKQRSIDFADKIRSKNAKSSGNKKFNTTFKSLPKVY